MKYIIFKINGLLTPMIFPGSISHSDVAKRFAENPISAGTVETDIGSVAHGSLTLKIEHDINRQRDDSRILIAMSH